jgi:hypothetical protein
MVKYSGTAEASYRAVSAKLLVQIMRLREPDVVREHENQIRELMALEVPRSVE